MRQRLSRKAKIRRVNKRRAKLKPRNKDVVGLINRNGGGFHSTKASYKNAKAPPIDEKE